MTAPLLGVLGLVLSLIVPNRLARARWPSREPRAAVLLWQCVTLASVLSAVGVVLAAPEELTRVSRSARPVAVCVLLATLAVAGLIMLRLLLSLAGVIRRSRTRRARHRLLVDLLARAERQGDDAEQRNEVHPAASQTAAQTAAALAVVTPGTLRILDGVVPFAYCLPGRSPRVVLSDGALQVLATDQVAAVLAHEQAHLRARHDVVMEAFAALYRALPTALRSRTSLDAVHLLLEMLADDAARHRCGAEPLAAALRTMGSAADALTASVTTPEAGAAGRDTETERRRRLARLTPTAPAPSSRLRFAVYLSAASVLVLPTLVLVVPWLYQALPAWPL